MIRDLFLFSGHHASFSLLAIVIKEYFDHCNVLSENNRVKFVT